MCFNWPQVQHEPLVQNHHSIIGCSYRKMVFTIEVGSLLASLPMPLASWRSMYMCSPVGLHKSCGLGDSILINRILIKRILQKWWDTSEIIFLKNGMSLSPLSHPSSPLPPITCCIVNKNCQDASRWEQFYGEAHMVW